MSSPPAASIRNIVEPVDPRERFAKPPFKQEEQSGSGSARRLDPPRRLRRGQLRRPWPSDRPNSAYHRR